ncbi:UDP-N-acetylmuramoyl-tripeptide--D-alanyl-D-alanine ligase [Candidatus Kaiserbacteria bacterium]|nr:UDP-N-acetylmuramoyl-tripeptide--D-alanyl-D-alanine ligase [Candidatus Kaiserbacteria bacterium]
MFEFLKKSVVYLLVLEARAVLSRYRPSIIAITGSVGKTTTKDAIYAAISGHVYARRAVKSYNGELGVALTILGLENAWTNPLGWMYNILMGLVLLARKRKYPQWLVIEVGADRPGDIKRIAKWLRPDIAVFTGISDIPAHIEFFDSPEHVLKEKRALADNLKAGGRLILNGDDTYTQRLRSEFRGATVTYGYAPENDFFASHEQILYDVSRPATDGIRKPGGIQFRANHGGSSIPVVIAGALGVPRVYASLAAIAVAEEVGIDGVTAAQALTKWVPPPGRVRILDGMKGTVIIDDTYNSSPAAALAALDTLKSVDAKRRIAVIGDMLELGKYTKDAHRKVGERAAQCADKLITVGIRARQVADAALDAGLRDENILQYDTGEAERAADELALDMREGDVVLVKGSQSMRLERLVRGIMAEPLRAAELLVRTDPEWEVR